ncbi:hypothetical protein C8Q76DRAFT_794897 [Earliella scabrosa]|nr:hypothetical protein C8Q76DRAFT_794897 [Earliella scabrosa]
MPRPADTSVFPANNLPHGEASEPHDLLSERSSSLATVKDGVAYSHPNEAGRSIDMLHAPVLGATQMLRSQPSPRLALISATNDGRDSSPSLLEPRPRGRWTSTTRPSVSCTTTLLRLWNSSPGQVGVEVGVTFAIWKLYILTPVGPSELQTSSLPCQWYILSHVLDQTKCMAAKPVQPLHDTTMSMAVSAHTRDMPPSSSTDNPFDSSVNSQLAVSRGLWRTVPCMVSSTLTVHFGSC